MRHSEDDLLTLCELLDNLPFDCDAMTIGELDGFLVGIAICPQAIPQAEWLPLIWGDEGPPDLEDTEIVETLVDAIQRYHRRIVAGLTQDVGHFETIFQEDEDTGEVQWEDWVQGFETAKSLRRIQWNRLVEMGSKNVTSALSEFASLYALSIGEGPDGDSSAPIDADSLPRKISRHVGLVALETLSPTRSKPRTKSGALRRNAPCDCGSGKRYKHCCGQIHVSGQSTPQPDAAAEQRV